MSTPWKSGDRLSVASGLELRPVLVSAAWFTFSRAESKADSPSWKEALWGD